MLYTMSRFYLGGPTSVRGFGMYSIGPQSEGEAQNGRDKYKPQRGSNVFLTASALCVLFR